MNSYKYAKARNNPGDAGAGVMTGDNNNTVLGAIIVGLGIHTNYVMEIYAVIHGLE